VFLHFFFLCGAISVCITLSFCSIFCAFFIVVVSQLPIMTRLQSKLLCVESAVKLYCFRFTLFGRLIFAVSLCHMVQSADSVNL